MALEATLLLSAYSTAKVIEENKVVAEEQKKQQKLEKRRADIQAARERINMLRQQRIASAESQVTATSTGTSTGSGAAGAAASIMSQGASAVNFLDVNQSINNSIFRSGLRQTEAQSQAATWGAIGKVSGSVFQSQGGYKSIFNKYSF